MKVIRQFSRYIRDAFKSVRRNFSLSLASISCIIITLIVVAISIILSCNVENFAKTIERDVSVIVFVDSDATQEEIDNVEDVIRSTGNVESLTFKSKQELASEYLESNEAFGTVVSEWNDESNPLLHSFELKVKNIEEMNDDVKLIKACDKVSQVNYSEKTVASLITVFQVVERGCIVAVVSLILVTAFLIGNTIKLAIFSRKTEIEIMRLVGASNVSIKIPFVIEGLFLGVIGAIIPIGFTVYGYISLYNYFNGTLLGFALAPLIEPMPFVLGVSLILLLIGMLVGMFGSLQAVKKYLKI